MITKIKMTLLIILLTFIDVIPFDNCMNTLKHNNPKSVKSTSHLHIASG